MASQTGIAGHLKIGHQVTIGDKSGVMSDIPSKATVLGVPAVPDWQAKRQWLGTQQLPEMIHRLRKMKKQPEELNAKSR